MTDFNIDLEYKLSYKEAYDTFYLVAFKYSNKKRVLISILLAALTVLLFVLYVSDTRQVFYLFQALLCVILLFYVTYLPVIKAKRGASLVKRIDGTYKLNLDSNGEISLNNGKRIQLFKKTSRYAETPTIIAIRANSQETICIPKRILSESQEQLLAEMLKIYCCSYS